MIVCTDATDSLCIEWLSSPHTAVVPSTELISKYRLEEVEYSEFDRASGRGV